MLNGLDLFTGIGGITLALRNWVKPIAYCEIEPYCQSVLLQRMSEGHLPKAPIWDDIRELSPYGLYHTDIIYGGFPCQDISLAGAGKGLEGKRSGLFFEIMRLVGEIKPRFIFLENVPAITSRGGTRVVREIAALGYDCRWCVISAASVGALHRRERWFLLAHAKHDGTFASERGRSIGESVAPRGEQQQAESVWQIERTSSLSTDVADTDSQRLQGQWRSSCGIAEEKPLFAMQGENDGNTNSQPSQQANMQAMSISTERRAWGNYSGEYWPFKSRTHWQEVVSSICRVDDGISHRVDRLKSLGNSVVPIQVREAFMTLMGLK